ncbi:hypothetical protein [Rhodococcus sp. NPDC057529]|uniref:hypothetical protein n=1 Tax=Rhodococcus sp. NPDC057529 TaxID=3346158 RepID=UPI00366DCD1D
MTVLGSVVDRAPVGIDDDTTGAVAPGVVPGFSRTLPVLGSHPVARTPIGRRLVGRGRALLGMVSGGRWPVALDGIPSQLGPDDTAPSDHGPEHDVAPGSVPESAHRAALVRDLAPGFSRTLADLEAHPVARTPIGRRLLAHSRALLRRMVTDKTWPVALDGVPSQLSDVLEQLGRLARHTGRTSGPVFARVAARIALLVTLLGRGRSLPVEGRSGRSRALPWQDYTDAPSQPNAPPYALPAYGHREHAHEPM